MKRYQDINRETIDRWIEEGWEWGTPISHEQFLQAKEGKWDVLLTPTIPVPHEWIGDLMGKKVLGLASGGGQQMPIFTALGAECTVLDYSPKQIQSERLVAQREGFTIEAVQGDMTERLPFDDESFDLIFHPVSNCYIKEVQHVFQEAYRVLKPGGILLSGLGNEVNYLVDEKEEKIIWKMPFDPTEDEKAKQIRVNSPPSGRAESSPNFVFTEKEKSGFGFSLQGGSASVGLDQGHVGLLHI